MFELHILFATTDFVENNGPTTGLPKYLYRTSLKLVEWGHKVTVVACSNRTVEYEYYGIEVFRVRKYNIQKLDDEYLDEINNCLRNALIIHETIEKVLSRDKVDIIQYTNLSGISYFHDFNIPSIVRLSSYAKMWPLIGLKGRTRARTEIEIAASKKCDAIICPSNVVAKEFAADISCNVDVIETPFVMESIKEDYLIYDNLLRNKKYLLFFGTLIEYKGLKVIAEAAYKILSTFDSLYIVLIGDGNTELIKEIENAAGELANRIIYHGAISFDELVPVIKEAYAVMLPSLMENFSNACVEAMALKKVVIGTDGVSFEQLIRDGESGFLCEPGNSESLFDSVFRLMKLSDDEKMTIEKNARRRIEDLAPEKVTTQLVEYYKMVIQNYLP